MKPLKIDVSIINAHFAIAIGIVKAKAKPVAIRPKAGGLVQPAVPRAWRPLGLAYGLGLAAAIQGAR